MYFAGNARNAVQCSGGQLFPKFLTFLVWITDRFASTLDIKRRDIRINVRARIYCNACFEFIDSLQYDVSKIGNRIHALQYKTKVYSIAFKLSNN